MQIKFVIQLVLFICQDGRIYGSPDGVKSIATSVNLFFTRSRLLSYINQFARGYRLVIAAALLLALTFSVKAQTSQTYNATNTFKPAAGVTTVTVECWGGGGAGGDNTGNQDGGGGGGGGGGFSKSSLAVSTSTTYDVIVGAGGIGTTGTGSSGGDSWFNTYGTIRANGGTGGESPPLFLTWLGGAFGIGGSIGVGDTKYSGGNGGIGRWCTIFENKQGHGGPGGSSAGTGVNGISGSPLIYIGEFAAAPPIGAGKGGDGGNENNSTNTGDGQAGAAPGGGGGGSGDKKTYTPGNGGNGKVIITYTCPTYKLTSTTATDICALIGTTSTVTLTSSDPAGLPVGIYDVTYNRSSPIGTGLIASMSVTTAGSGTFTAVGFNTAGNSIITITNITSAGCSSTISTGNTTTIVVSTANPFGAGVITGTASVCKGSTGIIYNVPAIANATGYVWTLPAGASITAGASTNSITVSFDATVVSGNVTVYGKNICGNGAVSPNYSVTVNPQLPASVSIAAFPSGTICAGTSVTFTATPTNGGTTPIYQWKVNGTNAGTNSATYSYAPANNDAVTCVLTSNATCATGSPTTSNTATMVANPNLPVSISIATSANPVCSGTSVTFTAIPTNGGASPTYQWKVNGTNAGTNNSSYDFTPANGDIVTCVLTSNATCVTGNPATSNPVNMTVNPSTGSTTFTTGLTIICQDAPNETYTATASNSTSIAYSVLPVAVGAINAGTGVMDWDAAFSGTATIKATSAGMCGTTSETRTVTVTPSVEKPIFVLGASSARNQDEVSVKYEASSTNSTKITYSLDAASLAGGNTINSSTGDVIYKPLWSWKSIITATAEGCNGPKTEDHIVGVKWCYALFTANGALSCAGASTIKGDVGTFVGATTGFTAPAGPGILDGHIDAEASDASKQAAVQAVAVYNDLAAIPCGPDLPPPPELPGIDLAGPITLTPNVYCSSGAITITGDVTLDGLGNPNAVFIFKIKGALTTNTLSNIKLTNGAIFQNVYWRVAGAVVLSGTEFNGTIVNYGAITMNTGAALNGRALSVNGAIAITKNVIISDCYPLFSEPINTKPIFVPPGDFTACVENLTSAVYNPLTIDINPDRPDYYTFSHANLALDLNETLFTDDKPLTCTPPPNRIHWRIDFSPVPDVNPPHTLVTKPFITGDGQPSDIIGSITFPGDGVNFTTVVHKITWWITDCDNNDSAPQTRYITINPRPNIIKN